jgi:hypothetical protein
MTDDSEHAEPGGDEGLFGMTGEVRTQAQYDPNGERGLAAVIVDTVAALTGEDTATYRETPLHDYVDIDAVETLLFGTEPNLSTGEATQNITFQYRNFLVTVRADGVIRIADSVGTE